MKTVQELAEQLEDAYSSGRYKNGWSGCIKMLRRRGYNDRQIEAILRSKWTRWANDSSHNPNSLSTSGDLARFLDKMPNLERELSDLTRETFSAV